jgi:phage-related protein
MESYDVVFNSNNLADVPGVWLYNYDATTLPTRNINIHKLARRSLSIVTSAEYSQKMLPVLMRVCAGDRQDTEATLTDIKGLLQPQNGELVVLQSNRAMKYTATMNEFNIEWDGSYCWVQLIFLISTPVAEGVVKEPLVSFSTSLQSDGASFIVDGSYISEPLITVTISAVTGGTGSFSIFNASTNQGITISGTFTAGAIIEIDSSAYTVLVNGISTDFEGLFPVFPPGSQRIGYSDTFTTRTVTITVEYNVRVV